MSTHEHSATQPTAPLLLEPREDIPSVVPGTEVLAHVLRLLSTDAALQTRAVEAGIALEALSPTAFADPDPTWLRAEELLEEPAACPGERLFVQTLATAAEWHSAATITAAVQALALSVRRQQLDLPAVGQQTLLRACEALVTATQALPRERRARLRYGA
jgi:hypothetical protein